MKSQYGDYLYAANKDLRKAKSWIEDGDYYDSVVIQSQQCIEKSLKHLLSELDEECSPNLLRTHKLRALIRELKNTHPFLGNYERLVSNITEAYFDTRYPGDDYYEPDYEEAREALDMAIEIFDYVYNLQNEINWEENMNKELKDIDPF